MRRHAVLRTAFAWHGLPEPLQVVGEKVRVPLEVLEGQDVADRISNVPRDSNDRPRTAVTIQKLRIERVG